jgi:hypothetical protein
VRSAADARDVAWAELEQDTDALWFTNDEVVSPL